MAALMFGRVELVCLRSHAVCTIEERRAFGVWRKGELLERKFIQQALIHESTDDSEVALVVGGNIKTLGQYQIMGTQKDRLEWVAQVNHFLKDPSMAELRVSYGRTWPIDAVMFVSVLVLFFWWRTRTTYIIDQMHRVFQIEERILRTRVRTIPFDQIKEATIHTRDDFDGKDYALALKLEDETMLPIEEYSASEIEKREELVVRLNQAFIDAGKR